MVAALLAACGPTRDPDAPEPDRPPDYRTIKFADGFDGTTLDGSKWTLNKFAAGAGTSPSYNGHESACYDSQLVRVGGGDLTLGMASGPSCLGYPHRGSSISTYRRVKIAPPAVIEVDVCLTADQDGLVDWPAVWTVGVTDSWGLSWPSQGEIDLLEGLGGNGRATYHDSDGAQTFGTFGRSAGCRVVSVWWRDHRLTAYRNGLRAGPDATGVVDTPQILILGAQGAGDIGGNDAFADVRVRSVIVWGP